MAWSIFSDGGGQGAAVTWARDLLAQIGAPQTPGNQQMVYDWEVSEGGGGKYNPLNQGPVPGHPELTSTGPQYGGGAADFVSWAAGLQGATDYLTGTPGIGSQFQPIRDALRRGDPAAARADLIASPWAASHYGGGSGFSDAPLPGSASALAPAGGSASGSGDVSTASFNPLNPSSWVAPLTSSLARYAAEGLALAAGAALIIWGVARATGVHQKAATVIENTGDHVQQAAGTAAAAAALA